MPLYGIDTLVRFFDEGVDRTKEIYQTTVQETSQEQETPQILHYQDSLKYPKQIFDSLSSSFAKPDTSIVQSKPFVPTFQFDWKSFPNLVKKDPHPSTFESQFEEFNEYELEEEENKEFKVPPNNIKEQ